jgi:hypothetical protein
MRSLLATLASGLACFALHAFAGDKVAGEVAWKGGSLDALKGKAIRLEFLLKDADLYTFRAATAD